MMNKNILLIHLFIISGFILMAKTNYFIIIGDKNLITCINSFYFGMMTIKNKKFFYENRMPTIISMFVFLFLYFIKISHFPLVKQIEGFCLFTLLVQSGRYIMSHYRIKIIENISKISFNIFLFHHRIIYNVLGLNNPTEWYLHLILLGTIIILTYICSTIHFMVVNSIIKNNIFTKNFFCSFIYNR